MIHRKEIGFVIIMIISLVISLPLWASAEEVGNFTEVQQRVDYQKGESGPVTPAKVKDPVEVKDVIQTYDASRAQVEFRDKTNITIAPKSKVMIEDYMFDPSKFETKGGLNLIQGVMKVVTPTLEKGKANFTIKTSTAIMGIRGTEFIAISGTDAGKDFTVVYVMQGRVCIKRYEKEPGKYGYRIRRAEPGAPEEEEEICLDAGTMSVILEGQLPTKPEPVSAQAMAQVQSLVVSGITDAPGILGTLPGVQNILSDTGFQGTTPTYTPPTTDTGGGIASPSS